MKLDRYLTRAVPPQETAVARLSLVFTDKDTYASGVYRWVEHNMDMKKPLHQLAAFSALMFSYNTPNIFTPPASTVPAAPAHQPYHEFFKALPWVGTGRENAGGTRDGPNFIPMVATLMIALYEHESPLRKSLEKGDGLGPGWAEKHGKYCRIPPIYGR